MDRDQLYGDPNESFRIGFAGQQANMWTSMPGIVQDVDWSQMTCSVQPAIQGTATDVNGVVTAHNLPLLIHVPIVFPQAGGFALTLPLQSGDEVLISWACRCIDAWWQSGGIQLPMEVRMHDISDGFAIPGPVSQPNVISGVSATTAQLRTKDGTSYIELTASGAINMLSPGGVTITGNLVVTGSGAVGANLQVGGTAAVTGALTAASVKSGLIDLATHKHLGVTTGTGTSGGPTP